MNQNRYSKIFTKKKVASSAVCVVLAVSLFAGCAHFESIEYSQEISEENPQTVEAFDQFINDIFETEVTENTINLHFTISDPEKYGITDYPVTLGDLSIDAMADSNARLENYLSGLNSFSYTELTLNQQLTYDILENYFQLQLDMADMYLYDELLRPSTGVQAQLPILYEEYSFNSKKDVDYYRYVATGSGYFNFKFTNADGGNNQYWKLSVYDEKKNLLQTVETEDDLQISTAKLSFRKGKEVYLKVESNINNYACGHEYTLTVNQYTAGNWEQEYNDSFATATTVKKNKTCSANNYAVKDKDYFVYKAAKKGKVTIQVSLPDSGYWNVCVYNQKKKLVKQEDYAQTGQKFTVKAAKGQKLYVMVKARTKSAVGKTYRVTVKQK